MSKAEKQSEAALASVLVAWLKAGGWEVNEEVPFRPDPAGPSIWIADVVARRWDHGRAIVAVFEVKRHFGLEVMQQAERWSNRANQVFAVVPGDGAAPGEAHAYGYDKLARVGIGVIHVRDITKLDEQMALRPGGALPAPETRVSIALAADHDYVDASALEAALRPEHRDGSFAGAGTKTGTRATKTNVTLQEMRVYLAEHNNQAPLDEVVRAFKVPWIIPKLKDGEIPRIRLNGTGPEMLLELVEEGQEAPVTDRSSRTAPRERRAFG